MQVTINVSREVKVNGGHATQVFSATATSVEEAIKIAGQLANMAVEDLPAPNTDAAVGEKFAPGSAGMTAVEVNDAIEKQVTASIEKKGGAKKPDAKPASVQPPAEQDKTPADTAGTTSKPSAEPAAAPDRTFEETRQLVLSMAKDLGREKTVAALARFGAAGAKDLKPEQYNDAHAYFTKVIAKQIDPLVSETAAEEEFA